MIDFSKKSLLALAPLAGYTDLPFRKVVKKFGVDLTFSEMISANALVYESEKTFKMIKKSDNETPYFVQIAASNVHVAKKAVLLLNDIDGIDGIDLNCGCPAPKVVKQGCGSSLLNDLKTLFDVIYTIKRYSNKRYTSVKTRLGFDKKNIEEISKVVEDSGADFITIHGRTRAGRYKEKVDYQAIKEAKSSINIPVIANGDITSVEIANYVKNYTNCDALMIGRGAIGNPWIFYQLKHNLPNVSIDKKREIVLEHFDAMIEFYGDLGVRIFRKHLHTYSKSMPNSSVFRDKINTIVDVKSCKEEIETFFSL